MRQKIQIVGKLLLPALLLVILTADAQDVQIRARVDLVVVPVTVKGSGDKLITGLVKDDFIVLEDGQRQTIANFTADPVPLSAAVVVDMGLSAKSLSKVQQTFPALAGAFSQFDEVAVYRFDKFVSQVLDFSSDMTAVETAMKTMRDIKPDASTSALPGGPFSTIGPVINGAPVIPPSQVGVFVTLPHQKIKVLNDAIFTAASDLAKREGSRRKIVLVVSDGQTNGSDHSYDEAVNNLLRSGVEVYAIALDQGIFPHKLSVLHDYARSTGGDAYFVSSLQSIEAGYSRAAEQARNQYILGYLSGNKAEGSLPVFRNIEVKLAQADLETLHRKGYYQYP